MKKVQKLLVLGALCFGAIGGSVSAQGVPANPCADQDNGFVIVNTGPDSTNEILCESEVAITFTCNNGVIVNNSTQQTGTTGAATVNGNTTGGGATSGAVLNQNDTTTDVNASCAAGPSTAPGANNPTVATAAGVGAAAPAVTAAQKPAAIKTLPSTGSDNSFVEQAAISLGALTIAAGILQLATKAYRLRTQI